jgi:hypothetical protein
LNPRIEGSVGIDRLRFRDGAAKDAVQAFAVAAPLI